jgi:1-acyl-sn-glycerol-3-phosphate acyltransferase
MRVLYAFARRVAIILLSLYYNNIKVGGAEGTPKTGPVLMISNHSNLWLDVYGILWHTKRVVRWMAAEVTMKHPVVGPFCRMLEMFPIKRPEDFRWKGKGQILSSEGNRIIGKDTTF